MCPGVGFVFAVWDNGYLLYTVDSFVYMAIYMYDLEIKLV